MIYSAHITTGTEAEPDIYTKTSPKRTSLRVTRGLVYKVELDFPPGSAGLAGVAILDGGFQVWPSTLGQWFTGDGIVIGFDDVYLKDTAPYEFTIETYNEDETYPHAVNIRIGLVSKDIFMARFLPTMTYKYMEELILKLAAQQQLLAQQQAATK